MRAIEKQSIPSVSQLWSSRYSVHCIGCSRVKSDLDESNLRVADKKENEQWKNKAFAVLHNCRVVIFQRYAQILKLDTLLEI